jgi:MoaA/NifB/PqqE/SkfB family radical SAM enzyme
MNYDNFCVFPFIQIVSRTNSGLGPCCLINNLSNLQHTTLDEYWNSQSIKDIRQQMLHGKDALKECKTCKQRENNFGSSMRTDTLRDYNFSSPEIYEQELFKRGWDKSKSPNRLEIHVGNTCNLKCLTCNPKDSSMFLDEDRRLNISNYQQKDFAYSEDKINEIFDFVANNDIDILDLRGGESMLIPVIKNRLLSMTEKIYNNTTLRVQTNGTIYNEQWKLIFEKFNKIEIMISVDGFGPVNEYVRFPSNWSDIEKNIDYFKSHKPTNMYINTVVSNISLLRLDELLTWCYNKEVYCHLSPLTSPEIFKLTNLPGDLLDGAKQKLKQFDHHPGVQSLIDTKPQFDLEIWKKFCSMIDLRDRHRQNRIFDIFPKIEHFWNTN